MLKEQAVAHHVPLPVDEILKDYRLSYRSRQASIIGRHEVLAAEPNAESIFDAVYERMSEVDPVAYPRIL